MKYLQVLQSPLQPSLLFEGFFFFIVLSSFGKNTSGATSPAIICFVDKMTIGTFGFIAYVVEDTNVYYFSHSRYLLSGYIIA
jgi:hypothetical protein